MQRKLGPLARERCQGVLKRSWVVLYPTADRQILAIIVSRHGRLLSCVPKLTAQSRDPLESRETVENTKGSKREAGEINLWWKSTR